MLRHQEVMAIEPASSLFGLFKSFLSPEEQATQVASICHNDASYFERRSSFLPNPN